MAGLARSAERRGPVGYPVISLTFILSASEKYARSSTPRVPPQDEKGSCLLDGGILLTAPAVHPVVPRYLLDQDSATSNSIGMTENRNSTARLKTPEATRTPV